MLRHLVHTKLMSHIFSTNFLSLIEDSLTSICGLLFILRYEVSHKLQFKISQTQFLLVH